MQFGREDVNRNQNQHYNGESWLQGGLQCVSTTKLGSYKWIQNPQRTSMKSYGFRKWVVCFSLNPSQNTPGWLVMRKIELSPFLVIALLWAHNFWLFDFQHYFPEASAGYQRDNRMPCSTDWKPRVLAEGNRAYYRRKMYETIIKSHKRTWNEDTTFVATRWSEKCSKTHKN